MRDALTYLACGVVPYIVTMSFIFFLFGCGIEEAIDESKKDAEIAQLEKDLEHERNKKEIEDDIDSLSEDENSDEASQNPNTAGTDIIINNEINIGNEEVAAKKKKKKKKKKLSLGDSKGDVVKLFGTPDDVEGNDWYYSEEVCEGDWYCLVTFHTGEVVGQEDVKGKYLKLSDDW